MEQNYDVMAQSRANYYTAGSPIQFVRVELLKGDVNGDIAICLSFKNISETKISGLVVKFKCKDRSGNLLCDDQYYYRDVTAGQGEVFGFDDAVYISATPVGSVEVELDRVFLPDGRAVSLAGFKRVRLPGPRALPEDLAGKLRKNTGKEELSFVPQVMEQGWYCACGAFHPKEEATVYCAECGSDRILLQNALSALLQGGKEETQPAAPASQSEPTRMAPAITEQERFEAEYRRNRESGDTAVYNPENLEQEEQTEEEEPVREYRPAKSHPVPAAEIDREEDYEDDEENPDDELARTIIRWAPPVTVIICAAIIAFTVVFHLIAQ